MAPPVDFEKDNVERENESTAKVMFDVHDNKQRYHKKNCTKGVEKRIVTKYKTGGHADTASHRSSASHRAVSHSAASKRSPSAGQSHSPRRAGHCDRKSEAGRQSSGHRKAGSQHGSAKSCGRTSSKPKSRVEVSAKCYDVRRGRKREACVKGPLWQHGRYVRDECGSGIVAKRFDFLPSRKIWCKTPLSMYQATIGELARKILCRETITPRDVKPEPPCNIEEYIMPPCRGYYRKYDCLRPCEEDYAVYRGGKKQYRDRVQRYWEPCLTKDQKYKLNISEYAPQNAFLAHKLRRYNQKAGDAEPPCW